MWNNIKQVSPPLKKEILTKISDEHGDRNEQVLRFDGSNWWSSDGTYVWYTPTHWKNK